MRRAIVVLLMLCCGTAVYADGCVFVLAGEAKPRIPDQSALIAFDGKTERLVIETSVESTGKEFAWVVPVPSVPEVEAATPGLFPTLRMITGPRIVGYKSDWDLAPLFLLLIAIVIWLFIYARLWARTVLGFFWTTALVGFSVFVILTYLCLFQSRAGGGEGQIVSALSSPNSIRVLDRRIVGLYETVTISGADGRNITEWLNSNRFNIASNIQEALDRYAKEGWVFVAARVRRDSDEAARFSPHPLSFTFATSRAVYPMRLTGIENGPLTLDLFVVGNNEAIVTPLVSQRVGLLDFSQAKDRGDLIPVSHDLLQSYCKGFTGMTLLSGTLSPQQMKGDLWLTWKSFSPFRRVYYLPEAALPVACDCAAWSFVALSIVCAFLYLWRPAGGGTWPYWPPTVGGVITAIAAVVIGIVGGVSFIVSPASFFFFEPAPGHMGSLILFFSSRIAQALLIGLPLLAVSLLMLIDLFRVAMMYRRKPGGIQEPEGRNNRRRITAFILAPFLFGVCVLLGTGVFRALPVIEWKDVARNYGDSFDYRTHIGSMNTVLALSDDSGANLAEVRKNAATVLAGWAKEHSPLCRNRFTDLPVAEEDSPGNYVIKLLKGRPAYYYFDAEGKSILVGFLGTYLGIRDGTPAVFDIDENGNEFYAGGEPDPSDWVVELKEGKPTYYYIRVPGKKIKIGQLNPGDRFLERKDGQNSYFRFGTDGEKIKLQE